MKTSQFGDFTDLRYLGMGCPSAVQCRVLRRQCSKTNRSLSEGPSLKRASLWQRSSLETLYTSYSGRTSAVHHILFNLRAVFQRLRPFYVKQIHSLLTEYWSPVLFNLTIIQSKQFTNVSLHSTYSFPAIEARKLRSLSQLLRENQRQVFHG